MMSETQAPANDGAPQEPVDADEGPDALGLSALLSSRVCHDLINPVGAIGSGLDVLDDPEMDESMRGGRARFDQIRRNESAGVVELRAASLWRGRRLRGGDIHGRCAPGAGPDCTTR